MQGAHSSILPKIWSQASGEERNNCAESKLAHRIQLRLEFSKLASTTAEDCVGDSPCTYKQLTLNCVEIFSLKRTKTENKIVNSLKTI